MNTDATQTIAHTRRDLFAILGSGLFTNAVWDMFSVVVPLYGVAVGLNAAQVGLVVAARSLLPTLLSIHGGILMDQLGTRRVLLWAAIACLLLPLIYPLSGWFTVLMLLQCVMGLASSFGMAGSQTWAMQISRGETTMLAYYSIATRVGTFLGPVIVGVVWDHWGAWAAFSCIAVNGAGVVLITVFGTNPGQTPVKPLSLGVLLPRWQPHKEALLLATIPAIGFILGASFLRNSAAAIQSSIYVVYLHGIGMNGTLIGTLVAIAELSGVAGSLFAAPTEKRLGTAPLVLICIVVSVVTMAATPQIASTLALLLAACVLRGIVQGMSQPLMFAILSSEIAGGRHGASVGLRNAVVRLGSIVTPAVMGMVAETFGVAMSFYVIGGVFLLATLALALLAKKAMQQK